MKFVNLGSDSAPIFQPKRALILTKMTRYEYEKKKCQSQGALEEQDLKNYLESKQSDYHGLLQRHNGHFKALSTIKRHLVSSGIETQVVDRWQFCNKGIEWADVVFSAGGDGTFLLAASKVKNKNKPLIGLNTDPVRSEGYLCLPKIKYSAINFDQALKRLLSAEFK
ncbi:hypothetical protein SNE40_018294 [Patella caerulea]|uniref:NAD(+) kinase n=1 Tax=Patella caerulea TaxID=87958 RepID=A0AAN8PKF4_PATCE